ncbi:type I 3-dehydroquinate dehydratase [Bianquea renquensis]|jgi:type I 3-dehydroquinase|uniref:Type I 3-dehydroquinate dehydratase n=1 Tax=Bianquea renquensis TaxID=2763661 RepID=A0A926DR98_9FIRM|nr:type I 3-dehydroquinate dehydratase [Bianquea renquensis]MBC8542352.1 type I 3-dehydroquinate dehydratase [Bianquea renquensis]
MKQSFFENDKALLTVMVQADNPDRIKELIDKSVPEGAEAFGMQFEQLKSEYRTKEVYKDLFAYAKDKPVYVTNYRHTSNEGKTDDMLAAELVELAGCGADLCDVMGDYFDRQPDEVAVDKTAIEKQKELIRKIHDKGAKVLMSSHVLKYIPAEKVLEIALEHQKRGADICKIVTGADTMEQQLENLKIINMLKENLKIPFLFLCGGECRILRRIGGELGCCMYLCVHEYDALATPAQPLLKQLKTIRDNIS